jgi:uroporphyrinogen decarboxylase
MTTHRERLQACINGENTDRPPIALWRHFPVDDQTPDALAAAVVNFQSTYDFDLVKVTPASSFCVRDWGVEDQWVGDTEGTRRYIKRVIHEPRDWEKLPALEPSAPHLAGQLTCLRLIQKELADHTPVIQTVFSPLAQAKNLAGNETLITHLRLYPEAVFKGLQTIATSTERFVAAALETGIDGIFYAIQHAQASLLTHAEYESFGLLFDLQVMKPAELSWCNLLHLHGKDIYFDLVNRLKFQIVNWHDRETHPSLNEAQSIFAGVVCGGLRQDTLVYGNQDQVRKEAEDALMQTRRQRFMLGTGCVVPIIASHGNIMAARQSVDGEPGT